MRKCWSWRIDTWIVAKWILCFRCRVKGFIPRKVAVWKQIRMREPFIRCWLSTDAIFEVASPCSWNHTAKKLILRSAPVCFSLLLLSSRLYSKESGFAYCIRRLFRKVICRFLQKLVAVFCVRSQLCYFIYIKLYWWSFLLHEPSCLSNDSTRPGLVQAPP